MVEWMNERKTKSIRLRQKVKRAAIIHHDGASSNFYVVIDKLSDFGNANRNGLFRFRVHKRK
ncbi:hypothetical protein [Trichococcus shcherbakoviae]|uniref:hypothetical protein n=1 Tax=Trichococcus shcherbakoviae TaxID=2094020 RepID=UPI002AA9099B|nr:hypothetical protein [Trichococcus shcherbakoviae]